MVSRVKQLFLHLLPWEEGVAMPATAWPSSSRSPGHRLLAFVALVGITEDMEEQG